MDEKEQFCQQVREQENSLYTLAYGIVKNREDAADVVQDAILKAYCNLDSLRNKGQFRSWMMRIVRNTAIDYIRRHRDTEDIDEQFDLASPEPGADVDTRLTVWSAIQRMELPYRLVIILFYYESCSVKQISAITSTPASTVRQQLFRGRKILAGLLNKEDFTS